MQYLEMTQHTHLGHITSLRRIEEDRYVRLDKFTIRSLELLQSMQDDGVSLLDVIDRTVTAMGARMLKRWTVFPLMDVSSINKRLDVVDTCLLYTSCFSRIHRAYRRCASYDRRHRIDCLCSVTEVKHGSPPIAAQAFISGFLPREA